MLRTYVTNKKASSLNRAHTHEKKICFQVWQTRACTVGRLIRDVLKLKEFPRAIAILIRSEYWLDDAPRILAWWLPNTELVTLVNKVLCGPANYMEFCKAFDYNNWLLCGLCAARARLILAPQDVIFYFW